MGLVTEPEDRNALDHIHHGRFDGVPPGSDGSALEDKDARSAHQKLQDMTSCGQEDFQKNRARVAGAAPQLDRSSGHRSSAAHESVLMVDSL